MPQPPEDVSRGRPARQSPAESLRVRVLKRVSPRFTLDVDFLAPAGITIVFGRSGSGKTILLNCIAGLVRPDAGFIVVGQTCLFDSERHIDVPVRRRALGYLFQQPALFPHLTVEQNVRYGLSGLPAEVQEQRVKEALESLRVAHLRPSYPRRISGGEAQRVALARALVTHPRALLLDEPLSALDEGTKSGIMSDLRAWVASRPIPVLYVTHAPREAYALGENMVILEEGKILAQGIPQQVLSAPRFETVAELAGFENVFDATVVAQHEAHGTMTCRLDGTDLCLEAPLIPLAGSSRVRVAIRAGDILLAKAKPAGVSARNIVPAKVRALESRGVTLVAHLDAGVPFEAHLTPSARQELGLEAGQDVWLVIKTYSCHLVR
jgi:molybdate transport system ATP-binding protein